jgi:hypothetical protein
MNNAPPRGHYSTKNLAPAAQELATSQQLASRQSQRTEPNNASPKKKKKEFDATKPVSNDLMARTVPNSKLQTAASAALTQSPDAQYPDENFAHN